LIGAIAAMISLSLPVRAADDVAQWLNPTGAPAPISLAGPDVAPGIAPGAALAPFMLADNPPPVQTPEAPKGSQAFDDQLHLQATFSFWLTSANGSFGVGPFTSDFDVCFSELIKHADYAFNPSAELTRGNWLLGLYATYSKLSISRGLRTGGDINTQMTIGAFDAVVGYSIIREHSADGTSFTLTPVAGAQLSTIDGKIKPGNLTSRSNTLTFVDPIVGGRVVWGFAPHLAWRTEGTIGGFGVGSQLTWSAGTYLDWQFSNSFALSAGYRALAWEYNLGRVDTNMTLHGPWIGLTWDLF